MPDTRRRRVSPGRVAAGVWVVAVATFLVLPTLIVIVTALGAESYVVFPPHTFTLRHFLEIPAVYVRVFLISLALALIAALASVVLAVPAALAVVRGYLPGREFLVAVFHGPLYVPWLVVGVAFLQFYVMAFTRFGITLNGSFLGLALAHIAITTPYVLTAVTARLMRFDEGLEEAAHGLGASRLRTLLLVTLPVIKPAVLAGAFFAFVVSFDNVGVSLFIYGATNTPLPVQIYGEVTQHLTHVMYAVSTVTIAFSVVLTLAFARMGGLAAVTVR